MYILCLVVDVVLNVLHHSLLQSSGQSSCLVCLSAAAAAAFISQHWTNAWSFQKVENRYHKLTKIEKISIIQKYCEYCIGLHRTSLRIRSSSLVRIFRASAKTAFDVASRVSAYKDQCHWINCKSLIIQFLYVRDQWPLNTIRVIVIQFSSKFLYLFSNHIKCLFFYWQLNMSNHASSFARRRHFGRPV